MTISAERVGNVRAIAASTITGPQRSHVGTAPRNQGGLEQRRTWEKRYLSRVRTTDWIIVLAAVGTPALLHAFTNQVHDDPWNFLRAPLLVIPCWLLLLSLSNSRAWNVFGSGSTEYTRVAHATGFAFGIVAIVFVVFQWPGFRIQLLVGLPLGMILLLAGRRFWRNWLGRQRSLGRYASHAIVAGTPDGVRYVIERLNQAGGHGYHVVGVVTDADGLASLHVDKKVYPIVGSMNEVSAVAKELRADAVIVASHPNGDVDYLRRLSWQLEGSAAELILSNRLAEVAGPRISLQPLDGMPLIHVRIPEFEGSHLMLKRALDIVFSSAILLAISPILAIIAIAIKLDSKGPVFFRQPRIGLNGREFAMIKFRSMRQNAESELAQLQLHNEGAGPLFKMRQDPRITRVGRFIRKYSLDELPQFWNVLRGDMSVVGPRPPLQREVNQYDDDVFRRFYIKPGITGLWQISGRSDLSWGESVRLDLRYVENWSVILDLMIIWRTVRVVLRPDGAY